MIRYISQLFFAFLVIFMFIGYNLVIVFRPNIPPGYPYEHYVYRQNSSRMRHRSCHLCPGKKVRFHTAPALVTMLIESRDERYLNRLQKFTQYFSDSSSNVFPFVNWGCRHRWCVRLWLLAVWQASRFSISGWAQYQSTGQKYRPHHWKWIITIVR